MKKLSILFLVITFSVPFVSNAHPGRTDSTGCHTCKTNCSNWGLSSGEYHCHNSKGISQPVEPIKSTYGENGTGYITPAPEYKVPKVDTPKIDKVIVPGPVKNVAEPDPIKPHPASSSKVELPTTEKKEGWFRRFFRFFGI